MIININKPVGMTSFGVVKTVRNITNERKVGHGGTLDPFAEGVLLVGTGKDTKVLSKFSNADKAYNATLLLGKLTNTLDTEGEVIQEKDVPGITENKIKKVLSSMVGWRTQIPPMYSAKKINGVPLYRLARKNIVVKRKPIIINIIDAKLLRLSGSEISFSIKCSKGTYIRVVGKDIAEQLGTVGHLIKLVRTKVGNYSIQKSTTIECFSKTWKSLNQKVHLHQ